METDNTSIVIVDDHILLRNGLANLVAHFDGYMVLFEANNGRDFIRQVEKDDPPDLVLLDINMPDMDGYETALWIRHNLPTTRVLALSMYDNDHAIIRMIQNGARGYILKDTEPKELKSALDSIMQKGYYYSELVTGKLIHAVNQMDEGARERAVVSSLNEKEIAFLKLVCTELTYKEIAEKMFVSPRTIDGYRDALFEKLQVKTRVGLAIYAIRNGIVAV